ncbi:unnamed protein product [Rangifer tarandus platyrhynchus]|uniref:Uncharacterized protein n=2 Tax=Rangifer tarandus platyrhynchus TaxID=3082113 RepID=A0ABN8YW93_RANTA|nr:unnamed protein product [Rangifer tarandus platyrhynchus]
MDSPRGVGGRQVGSLRCPPAEPVLPEAARFLSSLELGKFRRETKCVPRGTVQRTVMRRGESVSHRPGFEPGLGRFLGEEGLAGAAAQHNEHVRSTSWRP